MLAAGAFVVAGTDESLVAQSMFWPVLVDEQALQMDHLHRFTPEHVMPVTHVRFNIFPDGGVSRLRLTGRSAAMRD
jgi:allantoicase